MHHRHLVGCAAMLAVAIALLALTGGSIAGFGLLLVALVCPLAMILGVKLLLGERHDPDHTQEAVPPAPPTTQPRAR